ncbi:MAG: hypothetical protein QXI32_04590 [Candidatus Bathyarchaeia archaeon]
MFEISEPREGCYGSKTVHDITWNGEWIGYANVNYIQLDDVKTFRKYTKRKLSVGQPYGVQVFIDSVKGKVSAQTLGKDGLHGLVSALKKKFSGLEERDIFILELNMGGKTIVGRGSDF